MSGSRRKECKILHDKNARNAGQISLLLTLGLSCLQQLLSFAFYKDRLLENKKQANLVKILYFYIFTCKIFVLYNMLFLSATLYRKPRGSRCILVFRFVVSRFKRPAMGERESFLFTSRMLAVACRLYLFYLPCSTK